MNLAVEFFTSHIMEIGAYIGILLVYLTRNKDDIERNEEAIKKLAEVLAKHEERSEATSNKLLERIDKLLEKMEETRTVLADHGARINNLEKGQDKCNLK